jgi:hypothetical protein
MTVLDLQTVDFPISPSPDARPFWDGVERGELVIPLCIPCDAPFWYPRNLCPRCGSRDIEWRSHSGSGIVHAFCIHHHTSLRHLRGLTPIVTALVDLGDGVRMMGLLDIEPDPATVRCDLPVRVTFARCADERQIPVFVPS